MRKTIAILTAIAPLTAACTTVPEDQISAPSAREPAGACSAEGVQDMIGQRATAELGGRLLARTGARELRWVPPRTAVTMDYRADRLTVSYDDAYLIERISCG